MKSDNLKIPNKFYSEEIRNGYKITSDMKRVWAVQLEILHEIIRICEEYGLKYCAIGGTLLGAVRHGGYIPWDDDLDIAMPRTDYNKFCNIASKELCSPFFLQTEETDPGYLLRHAKVRNSNTTGILVAHKNKNYSFNQGIFVDVFPLDNLPDEKEERISFFNELYKAWGQVYKYSAFLNRSEHFLIDEGLSIEQISNKLNEFIKVYEKLVSKYANDNSKESCLLAVTLLSDRINNNWIFENSDFYPLKLLPFEFINIPVPFNYQNILTKTYHNWREFVIADSLHGDVIFDVEQSYKNYLNKG